MCIDTNVHATDATSSDTRRRASMLRCNCVHIFWHRPRVGLQNSCTRRDGAGGASPAGETKPYLSLTLTLGRAVRPQRPRHVSLAVHNTFILALPRAATPLRITSVTMARMLSLVALCVAALLVCAPAARAQPPQQQQRFFGAAAPGAATTTGCVPPPLARASTQGHRTHAAPPWAGLLRTAADARDAMMRFVLRDASPLLLPSAMRAGPGPSSWAATRWTARLGGAASCPRTTARAGPAAAPSPAPTAASRAPAGRALRRTSRSATTCGSARREEASDRRRKDGERAGDASVQPAARGVA
jgi:hypothetical protein